MKSTVTPSELAFALALAMVMVLLVTSNFPWYRIGEALQVIARS